MLAARNLTFLLSVPFSVVFPKFYAVLRREREGRGGGEKGRKSERKREKEADLTFKVKFPLACPRIKLSRIYFCYAFFLADCQDTLCRKLDGNYKTIPLLFRMPPPSTTIVVGAI